MPNRHQREGRTVRTAEALARLIQQQTDSRLLASNPRMNIGDALIANPGNRYPTHRTVNYSERARAAPRITEEEIPRGVWRYRPPPTPEQFARSYMTPPLSDAWNPDRELMPTPLEHAQQQERDQAFSRHYRREITRSFVDHDEYLVAVFGNGADVLPHPYRHCMWINCLDPLPVDTPELRRWEGVMTGTRRDPQVQAFLTDSGYDQDISPDQEQRTHWDASFLHGGVKGTMGSKYKNTRTFLQILRSIKKNYTKLIQNPNAYSWKWFTQKLNELVEAEHKRTSGGGRMRVGLNVSEEYLNKALKILNKFTGHEFVFINQAYLFYKVWPKELCKSYIIVGEKIKWATKDEFDSLVAGKRIIKCELSGEFVWYGLMEYYQQLQNKSKTGALTFKPAMAANISANKDKICMCRSCGERYEIKNMIYIETLDSKICIKCEKKKIENPKVSARNAIAGYHSHRDWFFLIRRLDKNDTGIAMGLEVEMQAKSGDNNTAAAEAAWKIMQAQWNTNQEWNEAFFERDGSLSEGGLEMVSNPMALEYAKQYWSKMLPHMRKECTGWNVEHYIGNAGNYGIHITFDRKFFGDYRLARFVKFCDMKENAWFMRGIAQRKAIYGGRGSQDEICTGAFEKLDQRIMVKDGKISSGIQRYQPINIKGDHKLVEVRFFRTTLNTESFLKNIEFIDAMREWCRTTAFSVKAQDFCQWLVDTFYCHKKYPNLIGYLSREKLPVKGVGSVKNHMYQLFHDRSIDKLHIFNPTNPAPEAVIAEDYEPCV